MPSGITAGDLVRDSLRLVGAIATGETPTPDELNDGLDALKDLLEIWSTQSLAVYGSDNQTFNTVIGQAEYTIGTGGNWNTTRPVRINDSPYCTVNGVDFPIDIIGQSDYDLFSLKTQPGQIIEKMTYVSDFPLGRITLWPVPNAVVPITLSADRVLNSAIILTTTMNFPPGYLLAFKYALGIMIAPDYGRIVSDEIKQIAQSSMAAVKRANKVRRTAGFDAGLVGPGPSSWQRGY